MKQLQPESGNPRYANARASGVHAPAGNASNGRGQTIFFWKRRMQAIVVREEMAGQTYGKLQACGGGICSIVMQSSHVKGECLAIDFSVAGRDELQG